MQLNLISNSDLEHYTGMNTYNAQIAYAAFYLAVSAKEWFQTHINEVTHTIRLPTWARFVATLKAT